MCAGVEAKINPLFVPLVLVPCENDFLTTHTQFHACPPALNYPEGGILHKTHHVPVSAKYIGVAFQEESIVYFCLFCARAVLLYFVSNSFPGFTGVEA